MRIFALLLCLCWRVESLSASFVARNPTTFKLPQVPRGGQLSDLQDSEEVIDLDAVEENTQASSVPTLKSSSPMGILSPLVLAIQAAGSSYSSALGSYPIVTKSITAGVTFFLSDYTAQRIERPKEKTEKDKKKKSSEVSKHDWTRTLVSCAVGLFYFGPAAHMWYEWIFSILPGTSLVSTLQKAALGQMLFGPSFTCIFFATSLMQAGQFSIGNWIQKIKQDLPGAWLSGSAFWPLVDLISYSLVPIKFIPLFINLMSFIWTIYLSMIANRSASTKK